MKYGRRRLVRNSCAVLGPLLAFCLQANGITADSANPYQAIVDRNVFGLKPPPPPSKGPDADKPPPPKITLTGVTTILGNKRVLMNLTPPGKPGEQTKPTSLILTEGQREGEIEVLEIDEKTAGGTVKLKNYGQVQTLNMEKDGAKVTASATPPAPTPPPNAVGYVPPPVNTPGNPAGNPGFKPIPTRTLRLPQTDHSTGTPHSSLGTSTPGFTSIQNAVPHIDPDEQAISMLAEHVQRSDRGEEMPPLPPPLADLLTGANEQSPPTPTPVSKTPTPLPPRPGVPPGLPPLPQ